MFKILLHPNKKYEINVKHRPSISNNLWYWQFFQDDKQFNIFLQIEEEFASSQIYDLFYEDD